MMIRRADGYLAVITISVLLVAEPVHAALSFDFSEVYTVQGDPFSGQEEENPLIMAPRINNVGEIVFREALFNQSGQMTSDEIFFRDVNGALTIVADMSQYPGGFNGSPSISDDSRAWFLAGDIGHRQPQLLVASGSQVDVFIDSKNPNDAINFIFGVQVSPTGVVSLLGSDADDLGLESVLYKTTNGSDIEELARSPGELVSIGGISPANAQGQVAFHAFDQSLAQGIYVADGLAINTISKQNAEYFTITDINDAGIVAFYQHPANYDPITSGIYLSDGLTQWQVVDATNGGINGFDLNNANQVAYSAGITSNFGGTLYLADSAGTHRIIGLSDPLAGSYVTGAALLPGGFNDAGQIAFVASLADGRHGIFLADPNLPENNGPIVPEPSSLILLGSGLFGLIGFTRRKQV